MKSYILLLLFFLSWCYCAPFSLEVAKNTIFLAYASYCGNRVNQFYNCYWCQYSPGFSWVGNFGDVKSSHFGFVGYHARNKTIFVVFRGTDNIRGWVDDFTFLKVNYPGVAGAEVHSGIFGAYNKVRDQVKSLYFKALSLCYNCDNVIVTGHSLGGALSLFAGLDMRTYVNKSMTLYNYGSPRIGNKAFSTYLSSTLSVWRITRDRDPVPHVPFIRMGYQHEYNEIYNRNGFYKLCNGAEDPNCSESIPFLLTNPFDHGLYMDVKVLEGLSYGCFYSSPGAALEHLGLP